MPAAIAIPAIIGAAGVGGQLVGAKMASNSAKNAAKTQVAAADKAQLFNERVYGDQKQLMAPYVSAGNDSLARLMSQHWGTPLPSGMAPTGGSSAMLTNAARMNTPGASAMPPPAPAPQGGPTTLGAMQARQGQPMAAPPMQPGAGGMVRVKAPTGEMAQFSEGSPGLQMALQRGAVRVS